MRTFIAVNLAGPAFFGALWMMVFGGAAINVDGQTADLTANAGGALSSALATRGPEAVIYALFEAFPLSQLLVVTFVVLTFISFVTAMDSNTHSITGVCLKKDTSGNRARSEMVMKIFWGGLVGAVAFIMTSTTGIDGVRMLSNLGGLPGLFILISMSFVIITIRWKWLDDVRNASTKT